METTYYVDYFATQDLREKCELAVEGVGATKNTYTRGRASVVLRSTVDNNFELEFSVYILRSITSNLPVARLDANCWNHLRNLQLADATFGYPGRIDLLIGADIWGKILLDGVITGGGNEPCAIRTRLGWVVFGPATASTPDNQQLHTFSVCRCVGEQDGVITGGGNEPCAIRTRPSRVVFGPATASTPDNQQLHTFSVCRCVGEQDGVITGGGNEPCAIRTRPSRVVFGPEAASTPDNQQLHTFSTCKCVGEQRLDKLVHKFWEIEEPAFGLKAADEICEQRYADTVNRNSDGRYVVQIPFRPDAPALGNSYPNAVRQFHQLERRLAGNCELRERYINFMREYIALDHMVEVPDQHGDPSQVYFIPHHAVLAKFRVVFNASARTSNGVSLNETQLAGPQLHDNLVDIILRFRRYQIAVTGDVEKMFRQIQIDACHRPWQQILWRESSSEPLRTYQLKTVTYGMASSPFNATRTLRQCADDNHRVIADATRAAAARESILSNFYVDDYLDSAETPAEAITLARDVDRILQQGKFQLRKWNSNDAETLAVINGSMLSASELELSEPESTTVLGLHWQPSTDELFYKIHNIAADEEPTKRSILSEVARLYDPTGLLAPVIVTAKIFIQALWKEALDWDSSLPTALRHQWLTFRKALPQLIHIRVPRWLGLTRGATTTLHGFCDASMKAYAAVIYVRSVDSNGHTQVSLVAAKTKVAPVKAITIPRLELCAAHILVTLCNNVRRSLRMVEAEYTLWSDSSIVLCWLRKPAATLKPYVSNRVSYIQGNCDIRRWRYIRSEQNPADCASRGISPSALEGHPLWWNGPSGLQRIIEVPIDSPTLTKTEEEALDAESKPAHALISVVPTSKLTTRISGVEVPLVNRFSTLQRLLHTTALVRRLRPAGRQYWKRSVIAVSEAEEALLLHIREAQGNAFSTELISLESRSSVNSNSKLLQFNPFIDDNGVIRIGGRLQNADLPYDQRHPMIIPKDCALAALLINNAHRITLHGGIQQMLQYLRKRFWILNLRTAAKSHIHRCVVCKRHQRSMQQQQMASLPRSRVLAASPFCNVGLDYCGPFNIRLGSRRAQTTTKTYAVVFVCMCTKAVHIELAEDLSTRAFLDVFDRFVSRRGYCRNLYSDNGTQFVGADRQLQRDLTNWHNTHAEQHIADAGVTWHFIVPAGPHHGGLWEAAVKSAKKHLLRVVGSQTLHFHQLNTLLIRIEACLNSRPLVALHDDHEGGTALTPGEFLIGRPLMARPEPDVSDVAENRLKHWQRLQRMYQHFWHRWHNEYLTLLQARSKWARPKPNMAINDVVIIHNENLPPTRWRIGRIVGVQPGSDGLVRVVTIEYNTDKRAPDGRLIKHLCQRPVQKVCRLTEAHEEVLDRNGPAGQECSR